MIRHLTLSCWLKAGGNELWWMNDDKHALIIWYFAIFHSNCYIRRFFMDRIERNCSSCEANKYANSNVFAPFKYGAFHQKNVCVAAKWQTSCRRHTLLLYCIIRLRINSDKGDSVNKILLLKCYFNGCEEMRVVSLLSFLDCSISTKNESYRMAIFSLYFSI